MGSPTYLKQSRKDPAHSIDRHQVAPPPFLDLLLHHSRFLQVREVRGEMGGGGGDHGGHGLPEGADFRNKVWSMTGGPNCRPKHWKRNTAIAMFGIFLVCIPIAMKSAELEQRPHPPVHPIPSQLWCKNIGKKEY